jgi:hypothetical protein
MPYTQPHFQPEPGFEPVELPSHYLKAFVAIATAVLGVLVTALTDNVVTSNEVLGVTISLVTAVGVYLVPNLPAGAGRWLKAIVAVVGTAAQAAVPLVGGTWTTSSTLLVVLAALGALTVGITPNAKSAKQLEQGYTVIVNTGE